MKSLGAVSVSKLSICIKIRSLQITIYTTERKRQEKWKKFLDIRQGINYKEGKTYVIRESIRYLDRRRVFASAI